MKVRLFTFLLLLFSFQSYAQWGGFGGKKGPSIKGKISGKILDASTSLPVGYATISLKRSGSDKIINGTLSEDDGSFKFSDIKDGKYDLEVSFLGYEAQLIESVELTLKDPDYTVGDISLSQDNVVLDEVEIKDKRSLIENKVDKVVFNAEDDTSIAGGDATEVLRKVPMLSVDLDGNVSLRGSQQVSILINGKPSGMFSANAADALKMFPADQIKKVEVITSPGAKYDGEGSGGIINIITKKENIEGVAGTINASAGTRQNNGNINLNIGKGRFGFSTNAGVYYSLPNVAANNFSRKRGDVVLFSRNGSTNQSRLGFGGSASAFYDFNAYNAINTSINLRGFAFDRESIPEEGTPIDWFELLDTGNGTAIFEGTSTGNTVNSGYDWNTDYTKKFADNEKRELVFAVQVSGGVQSQDNIVSDINKNTENISYEGFENTRGFVLRDERIFNDPDNLEITGQIDYVQPVGKANKLEVGIKSIVRHIDSPSNFFMLNESNNEYDIRDPLRSNTFIYDQDVYASYASYNFYLGKFNAIIGARYERTQIDGDGDVLAQQNINQGYDNFLPNVAISRTLSNFRTLKLSYSERIQRPSLRNINPFRNTTDLGNVSFGNPTLRPELTKQVELGYNTSLAGISIFGTLYFKRTTDLIESIVSFEDNSPIASFANVGTNNSIGVNIFATKSIGKVTLRGGGDINRYDANGDINENDFNNDALVYRIFTSGEISITSSIKADMFGIFNSPRFTLQGQNPSFSMIAFGFRKDFKNSSLGIRIVEPWDEIKEFNSEIDGIDNKGREFIQTSSFGVPFRSFGVTYRYKFGKVDFKERRSKIKNTDQKAGDDGGMQQGGGNSGGNRRGG